MVQRGPRVLARCHGGALRSAKRLLWSSISLAGHRWLRTGPLDGTLIVSRRIEVHSSSTHLTWPWRNLGFLPVPTHGRTETCRLFTQIRLRAEHG